MVKELSALLRRIASKHLSDFYCLNYLHSFATKNKPESHKEVCENKDFCYVVMPSEVTKIINTSLINTKNLIKHNMLFKQILNV